ncbi:hypothetical protein SASPL_118133 [Salvia splendens]|uniref:Uncharacterized protein n=1 Tax=Salvia splendens TaxID=180675 RepID=A0A8X8Y1T6_SALSN|nr:hypothetical protein SASPL_118133 [Salvia splendens]
MPVPNLQPISQWKAFPPPSTEEAHEKIIQSRRLVAVVAAQIGVAAEALLLRRRSGGAPAGVSSSSIRNQYLRCYLMDSSSYSESTLTNGEVVCKMHSPLAEEPLLWCLLVEEGVMGRVVDIFSYYVVGYVIPICNAELRPYEEGLVVVLIPFQYVVCNRQGFHTVDPLDVDVSISEDVNVSDDDEKSEPSLKKSEPPLMWNADSLRSALQPIQLQSVLQPEPLSLSSIIKSLISIPDNRKTAMVSGSSSLVASISFSSDSATLLKAFNAEKQWISFPRIATGTEKPLTSRVGIAAQKSQSERSEAAGSGQPETQPARRGNNAAICAAEGSQSLPAATQNHLSEAPPPPLRDILPRRPAPQVPRISRATPVPDLQLISQWKAFPPPSTEEAHEKIIQSRRLVAVVAAQIGVAAEALLLRRRSGGAPAGVCQGRDGAIRASSSIRNQYLRCYLMDSSSYSESTLTNGAVVCKMHSPLAEEPLLWCLLVEEGVMGRVDSP